MIAVRRLLGPTENGRLITSPNNRPTRAHAIYMSSLNGGWTGYVWEELDNDGTVSLVVTIRGVGPNGLRDVLARAGR